MSTETGHPGGSDLPLSNIRILDASNVIAGPMAAMLLADFGAEVTKVEHPQIGDPAREHGDSKDGVPLWWLMLGRNKKCITLNLGTPDGQAIFRRLAKDVDVVIENYRVGTFERWGLDYETLRQDNEGLILTHISGFGRVGPRAKDPGFGTLAEAMSGLAHRTGDADGPPTLPPFGMADGVAGMATAYAIMVALHERGRSGRGQELDLAITEPLLTLLEPQLVTYDQLGVDLGRTGSSAKSNAPRGIYQTQDGRWIALSASTAKTARRLLAMAGRPDIAEQPWMSTADARVEHRAELDSILVKWCMSLKHNEALQQCREAEAPAALVYSPEDILADEQFAVTGAIAAVPHPSLETVRMPNVLFRMSRTSGSIRWLGPNKGEHNTEILGGLGIDAEEMERLRANGTI